MSENVKVVPVIDIVFDQQRDAYVRSDEGKIYPCAPNVARMLGLLAFSELRRIVGNVARVENGMVVMFVSIPKDREYEGAGAAGALDENGKPEPWAASAQDIQPTIPTTGDRVKIERYGCAVAWQKDGQLYAYPCDVRGAIEPIGYPVTRPSPEFLAAVNVALHCELSLADFPQAVVEGR